MKVSDNTAISMPMRNLISIVITVAIGVWAYFGVIERLNNLETKAQLSEALSRLEFANMEFEVSELQLKLRKNALDRQIELAASGLITSTQLENTQLAYSSSKQQFLNKQNLVKSSKNSIEKLQIQLKRRAISIDKARRNLDETEFKSPFDGLNPDDQVGIILN